MKFFPQPDMEAQNEQLARILNGGLMLQDNVQGTLLEVNLAANMVSTVHHGLGYVPIGFIVIVKDSPGAIYGANTNDWDKEILLIASTQDQFARIFVL
ncbi:MAG: hypothetical protein GY906_37065 [bacterium]|nr:hypothetical protein [bacterium]